jgi:hypothetical protein
MTQIELVFNLASRCDWLDCQTVSVSGNRQLKSPH